MLQAPNLAEEPARVRTRISCLWAHFSAVGAKRAATFASNTMRFGNLDSRSVIVARAFFHAATKLSDDDEDILPQEDSTDVKLSVFGLFAELFPEHVVSRECVSIKSGLTRLQFNKLGYEMYVKEQSRRVPAPRAKPGNPGYGFRRAKWRNVNDGAEDQGTLQDTLQAIGLSRARCDHVRMRVEQTRLAWEVARRPSRPAGPGRPRGRPRGDKAPEAPDLRERVLEGLKLLHATPGNVSSPLGYDAETMRYAQQMDQTAIFRAVLGQRSQLALRAESLAMSSQALQAALAAGSAYPQKIDGSSSLLAPHALLSSPASPLRPQTTLMAEAAGGLRGLLLPNMAPGTSWSGSLQQQAHQFPPSINLGLPGAGCSAILPFGADVLGRLQQQQQQQQQASSIYLTQLASGMGVGGMTAVGNGGASSREDATQPSSNLAELSALAQQASALKREPEAVLEAGATASKRKSESASPAPEERSESAEGGTAGAEAEARVEEAAMSAQKRRKVAGKEDASARSAGDPSTGTRDTLANTAAKLVAREQPGSSSPPNLTHRSSSASTSIASSPSSRSVGEEHTMALETEAICNAASANKASLDNLLACEGLHKRG